MKVESPPNDKKKVLIVGALGVVLLGAGVFQFLPSGEQPKPAPTDTKKDAKKTAEIEKPKNPELAFDLPARDPFESPEPDNGGKPLPKPTPRQDTIKPVTPSELKGTITTPLPPVNGSTKPVDQPTCPYSLAGIVIGDVPVAIFRDAQGGERLVRQGASLDGDTQVVSIKKNTVTIIFRGSTLQLHTGGNTVAK